MTRKTIHKILTTGTTTTAPTILGNGELAYSHVTGTQANNGDRLYIGAGTETGGVASSVHVIGGKYFTSMLDHVHGTTTANSALIVDANKHINELNIGTLALEASGGTGQTVSSINTNTSLTGATNTQLASALAIKSYIDSSNNLTVDGDSGTQDCDLSTDDLQILGTTNEINTAVTKSGTDVRLKIGLPDNVSVTSNLTVGGNLTVNGTTTTVNSTQITVDDPIMTLGGDTAPITDDNLDRGIEFRWHNGTNAILGFFGYDNSASKLTFIPNATNTSGVISGTAGNVVFGDIEGTGGKLGNIKIGQTSDNEIDTSSGNLTIDSAGGTTTLDDNVSITGNLTLTNDLPITEGGTGVSSFTQKSVLVSNASGALAFITGAAGQFMQFNSTGTPYASNTIDCGTY